MAAPAPFDGSEYRRTVLTPLRTAAPAAVDDVFWLGHVPRDLDDAALIAARLKSAKAFLNKEKSRPRQADVAAAVLKEWPRVEGVLGDGAARASLRARLGRAVPGADVVGAGGAATGGAGIDPAARRRRQVATALGELARLREEPELAEDLFAFLGLPVSATTEMLRTRVDKVGEVNRKRRPDRERSLVDELLMHSRELLVDGDPSAYRAGLVADAGGVADAPAPTPAAPSTPPPAPSTSASPTINYSRPPKRKPPAAEPEPMPEPRAAPDVPPGAVQALRAVRDGQGVLRLTWSWPSGVTEVFVAIGAQGEPDSASPPSRKVTNTKYEIDGGVLLSGVAAGSTIRVFSGRRDQAGQLTWSPAVQSPATIAP